MHLKKTVAIIALEGSYCAAESLRKTLEYFGYFVGMYPIGRPQHFMDILSGKTPFTYDYIVLECHGDEEGKILMGEVHESVLYPHEPRGNFGGEEISQYLTLKDTLIISTGCSTGNEELVKAFVKNGNTYIAPIDDPDGDSGLIYAQSFFYHMTYNQFNIEDAHNKARNIDAERQRNSTGMFTLFH